MQRQHTVRLRRGLSNRHTCTNRAWPCYYAALFHKLQVTGPGPAFQTCYTTQSCGTTCHRLGDHAANGVFGLMHSPAFGVSLNYVNGDNCSLSGVTLPRYVQRIVGSQRLVVLGILKWFETQPLLIVIFRFCLPHTLCSSISLDFICTATAGFITGQDLVLEQLSCAYNAFFHSRAGCPLQCPFLNNKLCAGNGVCDMDWSLNAPRCFCDVGFSGSDCTTPGDKGLPPPPSYGGNIAGGFFGGMFATVGLLVIYVAYLAHVSPAQLTTRTARLV